MSGGKRYSQPGVVLLVVFLFSNVWAGSRPAAVFLQSGPGFGLQATVPDLLIESASVQLAETCRPSEPLLYISAIIHNRGVDPGFSQPWSSVVYARESYARKWGNGLKLPAIAEGDRQSVTFPIYFLKSSPESMAGTHRFVVDVVASKNIRESDYSNNRFGPLVVEVPASLCEEPKPN